MVDLAKGRRLSMKWQSSGRPLFVRTVYVDGLRHAILTADDPVIQYVRTSTPVKTRRWSSTAIDSTPSPAADHPRDADSELACCLVQLALEQKIPSHRRRVEKKKYIRTTSTTSSTSDDDNSEDPLSQEPIEPTFSRRGSSISERVLQWLDLAGRNIETLPMDRNPRRYTSPPPSTRRRRTHVVSSAPARSRVPPSVSPPPRPPSIPLPLIVSPQTSSTPPPKSETTSTTTTTTTSKLAPINKQLSSPRPQLHIFLPWPIEGNEDND